MAYKAALWFVVSFAAMAPSIAQASDWRLTQPTQAQGLRLSFTPEQAPSYIFECQQSHVRVTQLGVTKLFDFRTKQRVPDGPGAKMLPGAALMALSTGSAVDLLPAEATPNPAGGWDLSIALPKRHPHLRGLARARVLSLFTTGVTRAVVMDADARKLAASFLKQCNSSNDRRPTG